MSSLDEQVSTLKKCGLDAGRQMISEKVKVVMIKDQDDNSIAFAEAIGPTPKTRISGIIHACFSAYERKDRLALEGLLPLSPNNAFHSDGPRFARPTGERGRYMP